MIIKFLICVFFLAINFSAVYAGFNELQPYPKNIEMYKQTVTLSNNNQIIVIAENKTEKKASKYFNHLINNKFGEKYKNSANSEDSKWKVLIKQINFDNRLHNRQYYKIAFNDNRKTIIISSPGQLGLLYGVVTFSDLIFTEQNQLKIQKHLIEDFPDYQRRLFVANPRAHDIPSLFDWALQNKLETIVLASRQHPWYEVTDKSLSVLKEIKKWKDEFGGPEVMQSHNIYEGRDIVISDDNDITALKNVIKTSYDYGIEKLMILSDDTPPYKFGEGYILTNENDKKTFSHFEAANTFLMNTLVEWFKTENMKIESYYVPAFYTYEEMHQGDMALFRGTPWEEGAFAPFYRDLNFIGKNMAEDIFLVWCGPYVRSRKITLEDLNDWTGNLSGRVPFLWDNTIYSHYPFTSTSMLTAWDNDLPDNFSKITAGNGMFINTDANSEAGVIGVITANDYLWNPANYEPARSLQKAVEREYGKNVSRLVMQFREVELEFRKTIGERKLWYASDSLWKQIRNIRFITGKNPFYYHLNYSRLKALRLQLKVSVPEPGSKDAFIKKCNVLSSKRDSILNEIKIQNKETYFRLQNLVEKIPDFNSIQ